MKECRSFVAKHEPTLAHKTHSTTSSETPKTSVAPSTKSGLSTAKSISTASSMLSKQTHEDLLTSQKDSKAVFEMLSTPSDFSAECSKKTQPWLRGIYPAKAQASKYYKKKILRR